MTWLKLDTTPTVTYLAIIVETFAALEYPQTKEAQVQRWRSECFETELIIPNLTNKSLCFSKLTWNHLSRVIYQSRGLESEIKPSSKIKFCLIELSFVCCHNR